MTLIKPRTRGKQFVRHITRLDRQTNETLYAYASFIGESAEYVLNQLVEMLDKDKEFLAWRTEHAESYVPRRPKRESRSKRRNSDNRTGPPQALPRAGMAADEVLT